MENQTVSDLKTSERESSSAPSEKNCNQAVMVRKQGVIIWIWKNSHLLWCRDGTKHTKMKPPINAAWTWEKIG